MICHPASDWLFMKDQNSTASGHNPVQKLFSSQQTSKPMEKLYLEITVSGCAALLQKLLLNPCEMNILKNWSRWISKIWMITNGIGKHEGSEFHAHGEVRSYVSLTDLCRIQIISKKVIWLTWWMSAQGNVCCDEFKVLPVVHVTPEEPIYSSQKPFLWVGSS